jgi:fimbrial chaperone protein
MFKSFKLIAAAFAGIAVLATAASAYRVTPLLIELADSGRERSGQLRVENTTDRPLTFEAYAIDWSISETGERNTADSGAPLLVFPPQAIVQPGETQVVRVEWVGGPVEQSQNFIVMIEQLPVDFTPEEAEGSGVQFLFNFGAAVHVSPDGAQASLAVASAERDAGTAVVRVSNSGDRHAYLGDRGLTVSAGGVTHEYTGDELAEAMGNTLIAAGATRQVRIALPENFPAGPLTAALPERD